MIGITEEKTLGQESVGLTKTKTLQTLLTLRLNDLLNTWSTNLQRMDALSVGVQKAFSTTWYYILREIFCTQVSTLLIMFL